MRRFLFVIMALVAMTATGQTQLDKAVDFLYQYMTPADKANYSRQFMRDNARIALYARVDMPWGESVPDELWRHFVLPPRVNNEFLDDFRTKCYDELRLRVQDKSMLEAALEVNHWCHEYVTYRPSDGRTSSPLSTMLSGKGRCGEESVLAVAAMRTVGIPARQVYTPRWAHTDDNHAWIEVWVDGKWYFMGACEPEPVLNMAWFNSSAARALLMHTQVYGDWQGAEDVIQRNECFTEINCISNYVDTRRCVITVKDTKGQPVSDALVEYKIYNYGEFCTVASAHTDAKGQVALTTGLGDMMVWASKDGRFGFDKMDGDAITLTLNHKDGDRISMDIEICPPAEGMIPINVTDEQVAANKVRLEQENDIRARREARFIKADKAREAGFSDEEARLIEKAEGNSPMILSFIRSAGERRADAVLMLQNMTDKDLRDAPLNVLSHRLAQIPHGDGELYGPYILSPRIELEQLANFDVDLDLGVESADAQRLKDSKTQKLIDWVRDNIQIVKNPRGLRFTPQAVYNSRQADARSRDIFFVALCRVNGIPARIESVTGRAEYHDGKEWLTVNLDSDSKTQNPKNSDAHPKAAATPQGKLRLTYKPTKLNPNPAYYRHFTLTKVTDGVGSLLNYEEGDDTELGAATSAATFSKGHSIDTGYYLLTTGSRMSSGKVLAHIESFSIKKGGTTTLPLQMREPGAEDISVIGNFNADPLLPQTGRGYFLMMLGGKHDEPTSHARQELDAISGFLTEWGRPVLRLDGEENAALVDELRKAANSTQTTLPVVVVADSFGRILFFSEGYNTSLGEQLKRTILHL